MYLVYEKVLLRFLHKYILSVSVIYLFFHFKSITVVKPIISISIALWNSGNCLEITVYDKQLLRNVGFCKSKHVESVEAYYFNYII